MDSQPSFNKGQTGGQKKDFENSVMEFFKDEHTGGGGIPDFEVVPAYEDPTERMDFSHDISKIKVSSSIPSPNLTVLGQEL
jgi:hypothetical protein